MDAHGPTVRLMTWNIHGAVGRNPRFDLARVVEEVVAGRVALLAAGTVVAVGSASALWRWGLRSYTGASA